MRQRPPAEAGIPGSALRFLAVALLTGMFWGGWTSEATAATFSIDPTQVVLTDSAGSAVLTLTNRSTETLRFQLSVFAWSQSDTGEIELEETEDIVFFPALLSLAPGEARRVRIGSVAPFETREKSYRIFVEELPPLNPSTGGVRVLTRMGVPIFLRPRQATALPRLSAPDHEGDRLRFTLSNDGSVHFVPRTITVRTLTGDRVAFETQVEGWYVLAGGRRDFELPVPEAACEQITSIEVDVRLESDSLREWLQTPNGVCAS
jgi:fimbrial chaperone protein